MEMSTELKERLVETVVLPVQAPANQAGQQVAKRARYRRAWTTEMNHELEKMIEAGKTVGEVADYVRSTPSFGLRTRRATKLHVCRLVNKRRLANSATDALSTSDYVSEMNASITAPSAGGGSNGGSSPAGPILPSTGTPTTSVEAVDVTGPA